MVRKMVHRWGGWFLTSLLIVGLIYVSQKQTGHEGLVVEAPKMFVFPDTPPGVMEAQRRAALEQFPGLETERVFGAFVTVPEFRHMLQAYGPLQAMPHMLKCMDGITPETTDQEAQEKALCAWRVVQLVSAGPLSQSLLASNPRIAIQAYGLYGHTKEWQEVVQENNPPFVGAVLANCLDGKEDAFFNFGHGIKVAAQSVIQGKKPEPPKKLNPAECGWHALQRMQKMGPAFFTQFTLNDKGEAVRLNLGTAGAAARELFLGNLLRADEKHSLGTLTAGDVGWATLDVAGVVGVLKLPGLALKAATLGKAGAVAGAGAAAVGKVGLIAAVPIATSVVTVGGGAYLLTHPTKVGEYIGKPLAQSFGIPVFLGGFLGWALVAYLLKPLWLPLLRFGWRQVQRYRSSRSP